MKWFQILTLSLAMSSPAQAQGLPAVVHVLEGMDRRFEGMSVQQQQADRHRAALGQRVDGLESRMSRYDSRADALERRVAALEAEIAARAGYQRPAPSYQPPQPSYQPQYPASYPPQQQRNDTNMVNYQRQPMLIPASSSAFSPTGNYDHMLQPGSYILIRMFEVR
jgi:hypothetical protein